jgi:Protein of unknown function (DUF1499)
MALKLPDDLKGPSRWTVRLALFALSLTVFAVLSHRLFGMATPVALNIVAVALGFAGLALVAGLVSTIRIWRQGTGGGIATLFGMVVAAGLIAWPIAFLPTARNLPRINDITTDVQTPPRFTALPKLRPAGANSLAYPGAGFASAQAKAYPDIRTFQVDRSAEETYELVLAALNAKTMKLKTTAEEPPKGRYGQPGQIELVDRTFILGFADDVVIRVDGDAKTAKIDVRSVSRYGSHDFGRNAQRVRRILKEIQAQVEATIPTADGSRPYRLRGRGLKAPVPKRQPGAGQTSAGPRSGPVPAKSDAPRAPVPKDRRPSQDARQGPGTRG